MPKYQVAIIKRPANWKPESADDVPLELSGPVGRISMVSVTASPPASYLGSKLSSRHYT